MVGYDNFIKRVRNIGRYQVVTDSDVRLVGGQGYAIVTLLEITEFKNDVQIGYRALYVIGSSFTKVLSEIVTEKQVSRLFSRYNNGDRIVIDDIKQARK